MTQDRKRPTGTHNPSASSLRRWDNEGGAPVGGRAKRHRDPNKLAKSMDIATGAVPDRPPTPEEQGKDRVAVERGRKGGAKGGKASR
jgi:hypothetical protein